MGIKGITSFGDDVMGGVTNGAYREVPWHGVGESKDSKGRVVGRKLQITDDPRTTDEIMDLTNSRWSVTPKLLSELGVTYEGAEDIKLLVREDVNRILGVASESYGELQNDVGHGFTAEILRHAEEAHLVATTELFGGQVMFNVVEFDKGVEAVRRNGKSNDKITHYMGVYWSHNGRYPLGVKYMNQLWVCRNTFTPTTGTTGLTVRHTRNAGNIASNALLAIEGMVTANAAFEAEVQRLLDIEANADTMRRVVVPTALSKEYPKGRPDEAGRSQTMFDNSFAAIMAEWSENTDEATAFDCVMAVQGWEQHRMTVRGKPRDIRAIERILQDDYPKTALATKVFDPVFN